MPSLYRQRGLDRTSGNYPLIWGHQAWQVHPDRQASFCNILQCSEGSATRLSARIPVVVSGPYWWPGAAWTFEEQYNSRRGGGSQTHLRSYLPACSVIVAKNLHGSGHRAQCYAATRGERSNISCMRLVSR